MPIELAVLNLGGALLGVAVILFAVTHPSAIFYAAFIAGELAFNSLAVIGLAGNSATHSPASDRPVAGRDRPCYAQNVALPAIAVAIRAQ